MEHLLTSHHLRSPDGLHCGTSTVIDKWFGPESSWLGLGCIKSGSSEEHQMFWRRVSLESTTTSTMAEPTTTLVEPTADPTPRPSPPPPPPPSSSHHDTVTASVTVTPTTTGTPDPSPGSPSSSKAWIAGAAAGPVVALLAIGGLVFWWTRRGRTNSNKQSEAPELDGSTEIHEAPVQSPKSYEASELPSPWSPKPVSELESREGGMAAPGDPRVVGVRSPEPIFEVE